MRILRPRMYWRKERPDTLRGMFALERINSQSIRCQQVDLAEPAELLSCAGSCTWFGSCTCAPHLTPFCARRAPHLTPLCARCTPRLTPRHASGWSRSRRSRCGRSRSGLGLSIRYCQYSRGRREAERSRQSQQ